jgi:hypothetical protein
VTQALVVDGADEDEVLEAVAGEGVGHVLVAVLLVALEVEVAGVGREVEGAEGGGVGGDEASDCA